MANPAGVPLFHAQYLKWERYNDPARVPSTIDEINVGLHLKQAWRLGSTRLLTSKDS